jgi:ankyrin repeat protein
MACMTVTMAVIASALAKSDSDGATAPPTLSYTSAEALAEVRAYLEKGGNPNTPLDWADTTLLHEAAGVGFDDVVSLLISTGANVNAVERGRGNTPLHLWCAPRKLIQAL